MSRKPQRPFHNYARTLRAVTLANAHGLAEASARTGVQATLISKWRTKLERLNGARFARPLRRARGGGKLTMEKARELRFKRARGVSWGILARIYGVSPTACVKVWKHELYPDPAFSLDRRAA